MLSIAQISDKLFAEVSLGLVKDLKYTDKDINLFSPDMSSSRHQLEHGKELSIGYQYSKKIALGVSYLDARIYGSNDIEYFKGNFTDLSAFIQYDLYKIQNVILFATAAAGKTEYAASRFLVYDDTRLPINSPDGKANKKALGIGAKADCKNNISIVAKYTVNEVDDDGFDGWDYGSNVDRYGFMSIGVRMNFNN